MSRISWHDTGKKQYAAGVDRAVLFVDGSPGVPWNGITAIDHTSTDVTEQPFYIDGVKYRTRITPGEYQGSLSAYMWPDEFDRCDGIEDLTPGFNAANQDRSPFSLSYRTLLGNDIKGLAFGYKLHFLYDLYALTTAASHSSIGDTTTPVGFTWTLTALPLRVAGFNPTAHFTVDSRKAPSAILSRIESILYGTESSVARLPTPSEIVDIFATDLDGYDTFTSTFKAVY